jgi:hypothetical protein
VSGQLRPRISRLYFCLFGAVWNLALGPGHVGEALGLPTRTSVPSFDSGRLGEMLETARRSGHDTYRT